jgi:hypothetical protein
MAEPAAQYPAAPGDIRLVPAPDAGANVSADIVELIMADHRRIGRLCNAMYDIARHGGQSGPDWMLGHAWQRLADLLVAHIQAEEETCYSSVSGAGPRATARIRDSIADHDAIRQIIGEASLHPVGSAPWWHAVRTVMAVSAEHHEREERDVLPGYVLGLGMSRRKELGRQWCAFMASWKRDVTLRPVPRQPLAI